MAQIYNFQHLESDLFHKSYAQLRLESTHLAVFFFPMKIQYNPNVIVDSNSVFNQTMKNDPAFPVNLILLPSISTFLAHAL